MNKVLLLVLGFCLAQASLKKEDVPVYDKNQEYLYRYEGEIKSGIPQASDRYCGMKIRADVRLQFQTTTDVRMRLENINLWTLRGELESEEERKVKNIEKASWSPGIVTDQYKDLFKQDLIESSKESWLSWWKSSSEAAYEDVSSSDEADEVEQEEDEEEVSEREMEEFRKQLVKVIKFQYETGHAWDIEASEDEPQWSVNIKRGVLNLLQLKMDPLQSELLDKDESDEVPNKSFDKSTDRVFRIMEKGVSGECETLYNIRDTLAGRNVREVSKIKDFKNCVERPEHAQSLHSAFIPHQQEEPKRMLQSTVATRVGVLVDDVHQDRFLIKAVESHGQHVFQAYNNKGSNVVTYSKQNLKMIQSQELTTPMPISSQTENKGDLQYVFEQNDQQSKDKDGLTGQEITNTKKETIQRLSQELSVDMRGVISPESPQKFMQLVRELRSLNEKQLLTVLEDYHQNVPNQDPEKATEEETAKKQTRKVIIDALSLVGTKECLKAVKKLVDAEKVYDFECEQLLSGIALSIEPCPTSPDVMMDIAKSQRSRSSPKIHKSAWLAFGVMVNGLVKEQKEGQLTRKSPQDEERTTQLIQKYSQNLLMCVEREKSDDEKLTCLKAIGNAGLESTVDRLRDLISGKESDIIPLELRVQAIYALRRVAKKLPNKIHNILYPVYSNPEKDTEERIAAVSVLIDPDVKPTTSFLQLVAQSTQRETSNQVGQYVYQYLKKVSESQLPKDKGIKKAYSLALRLAKPFNRGLQYSQSKKFHIFDDEMRMGASLNLDIIGNKKSIWPRFAKTNVELQALGYHINLLEAGVRLEGLQPIIESLYGKKSEDKKNVFDYLQRKSKERSREYNTLDAQHLKLMNKMNQKLPIETRRPEEPQGNSYIKWYGNEVRFDQLKKEHIRHLMEQGKVPISSLADQLRKGLDLQMRKATKVLEASRRIPTELGVPLVLDINSALLMKSDVSGKMEVRPRIPSEDRSEQDVQTVKFDISSNQSAVLQIVGKMSVDCHVAQSGVAIDALVNTTFPVSGKLAVDLENKKHRLNIKAPDQKKELFVFKSDPFVYTEQKKVDPTADGNDAQPIIHKMDILGKEIQKHPTQVHASFGREELGFEFSFNGKMISRLNKENTSPIQPLAGPIELKLSAKPGLYPPTEADIELRQPTDESISHLGPLERLVYTQQREQTNEGRLEIDILAKNQQHPRTMNIKVHYYDTQLNEDFTSGSQEARVSPRFHQRTSEEVEPEVSSETSKQMKELTNKMLRKTVAVQVERSPVPTKESEDWKGCLNMEFEYPMMPEWRLIQDRKMKTQIDAKWGRDCSGNDKMLKVDAKWQKSEEQRRQERLQEQQDLSDADSSEQDGEEGPTMSEEKPILQEWNSFKACLKDRRDGLTYSPACRLAVEDRSRLRQLDIDIVHLNLPSWMEGLATSLKRYVYFTFFDRLSVDDIDVRNEENKAHIQVVMNKNQDHMNVSINTPNENAQISHIPTHQPKIKMDFFSLFDLHMPLKMEWSLGFPLRFPSTKKSWKQQYLDVIFGRKQPAYCEIKPNDRIQTFDGVEYKHKIGKCDHVLAKDSSPDETFLVLVKKEDVEKPEKTVQVFVEGKRVELTTTQNPHSQEVTNKEQDGQKQVHVFIDGRHVEVNPLKARQVFKDEDDTDRGVVFILTRVGSKVVLDSKQHGLVVESDGRYVQVQVPNDYRGKLSGLCGNFDGEEFFEYEGPSQEVYRSPFDFGLSYRIPSKECQEDDNKGLSVMRNARITRLNDFNKKETCFSKTPIPRCPEGYGKTESEGRELEFHCVPTELESTRRLIELHKTKPLEKMTSKRTDLIEEVEAELECEELK